MPKQERNNRQLAKREEPAAMLPSTRPEGKMLSAETNAAVSYVLTHTQTVRAVAEAVMKDGTHYGTIPGTLKPTLYQAGAQALMVTFKLRPKFTVKETSLPATISGSPHREYYVETELLDATGAYIAMGVGLCSTMESKYRYRGAEDFTDTGEPVPSTYWNLKTPKEKTNCLARIMDDVSGAYGIRKIIVPGQGQVWHIVKFPEERTLVENPNIADCYNTVLKIAKKRSAVDATLNATGASDVFSQDLEDLEDNLVALQAATGEDLDGTGRGKLTPPATAHERKAPAPPAGVSQPLASNAEWKNVVVHIEKSRVHGKRLGELDFLAVKALQKGWSEKMDWANNIDASREDRRLRKALVEALSEHELLGTAKNELKQPAEEASKRPASAAQPSGAPDTGGVPMSGVKADASLPGKAEESASVSQTSEVNERDGILAEIEHLLLSHEIEEADFLGELKKRKLLGPDAEQYSGIKDLPGEWLPDLLPQIPGWLKQWGYVT